MVPSTVTHLSVLDCIGLQEAPRLHEGLTHLTLRRNGVGVSFEHSPPSTLKWLDVDWVWLGPLVRDEWGDMEGGQVVCVTDARRPADIVPYRSLLRFPGPAAILLLDNPRSGWNGAGRTFTKIPGGRFEAGWGGRRMQVLWANDKWRGVPIDTRVSDTRVDPGEPWASTSARVRRELY